MNYKNPRFLFREFEVMRSIQKRGHFLEIGSGDLNLAKRLLDVFAEGTILDFNTAQTQQIYEKLPITQKKKLRLIIADFTIYDDFNTTFDCVISCEVLEHVENDQAFLDKIFSLLTNKGQLILSVPARQKYWSKDDEIVGHYRRYEKEEIMSKLTSSGFSDIKIESYGFPFLNFTRMIRINLAKIQYREKSSWNRKKQSQQSAFLIGNSNKMNWIALFVNKFTLYPLWRFSLIFNNLDLSDGYIISAFKNY